MGRAALLGGVREPAQSRARLPASAPGASRAGLAHLAAAEGLTPPSCSPAERTPGWERVSCRKTQQLLFLWCLSR